MLACLSLVKILTYAVDYIETVCKSELDLLNENGVSLTVILPSLGMSEDGVLTACGSEHCRRYLSGVCTLLLVSAVLC